MLKILILMAIVLAAWMGGAPISQIFSAKFAGVLLIFFITTLLVMRVFMWLRLPIISWIAFTTMIAVSWVIGGVVKYTISDLEEYEMTTNIPVGISRVMVDGKPNGQVTFINQHTDMLRNIEIECVVSDMYGAEIPKKFSANAGGSYEYAPGTSGIARVIYGSDFKKLRANAETMACEATNATFTVRPKFFEGLELKFVKNSQDFKYDFIVTNHNNFGVRNIQFTCMGTDGVSRHILAFPANKENLMDATVIGKGETVRYVDDAVYMDYASCVISNGVAG